MYLVTLGGLHLEASTFQRLKPLLLLSYLSLEGPRSRRHLADLFYSKAKNPLNSLSRALSHLRSVSDELLETDGVLVSSSVACDAKVLERLLDTGRWSEAVGLYERAFLQGLALELEVELEEWILITREHLAGRVREAHLRLGESLAAQGKFDAAARHAELAYALPGADELEPEDFERAYTLFVAGGSPQAADIRREAASFGIRLFLNVDDAKAKLFTERDAPLPGHNLPRRQTSFVGRNHELAEIGKIFDDARHRLLSILGPGGVGKSRLAVEAAYRELHRARFSDGTVFVELDPLDQPSLIPGAIAKAMKLELQGAASPLEQVTRSIGSSRQLLILDNFEHLIAGADVIHNLLDACSQLSILVTSRERLNLADEWVLELGGLVVAREDTSGSDAMELFVGRAKRARLGFSLTHEELPHVRAICELVGGLPLGIELAAAWIRVLAPDEIAAEIKKGLSFLTSQLRDVSGRQRSINAAFEYSWKQLTQVEQRVMSMLSVFEGGFSKDAAAQVAEASLPILASLVDKSLLIAKASSRYERHALLFQFSQAKLADLPEAAAQARSRHAAYFHAFLQDAEADLRGPGAKDAMNAIEADMPNIRLAWSWAVDHADAGALVGSAMSLRLFFDRRGRFREGAELYAQVTRTLEQEHALALGYAHVCASWLYFRLGNSDAAYRAASLGTELLEPLNEPRGIVEGLATLAVLAWKAGTYDTAKTYTRQALDLTSPSELATLARLSEYLGIFNRYLGLHDVARKHYIEALEALRQLGHHSATISILNNLATLDISRGDIAEAESFLTEGLSLAQQLEVKYPLPLILNNLAKIALAKNDPQRALSLCEEGLNAAEATNSGAHQARIHETLGRIYLSLGHIETAKTHFVQHLKLAHDAAETFSCLQALTWIAVINMQEESTQRAATLLGHVLHHPALSEQTQSHADEVLGTMRRSSLPEVTLSAAFETGKNLPFADIVSETLLEYRVSP